MNILLQIFLYLNIFLIGAIAAVAVQHAYAHFKPAPKETPKKPVQTPTLAVQIPTATKEQLVKEAEEKFHNVIDHSAYEFQHGLRATATQLNTQLENLGSEIVSNEMNRYRLSLDELREQAKAAFANAESQITASQAEIEKTLTERRATLEAKLAEEMVAEKQKLMTNIDTKLADSVASFLIETLKHDVDLGAQLPYMTKMLEEHKAEFKKELEG